VAVETLEIASLPSGGAPISYTVSGDQVFDLIGVRAVFDGTGAGGNFLPCVQIKSAAGHILSQSIGSSVTAGGSADVSFAPFLRSTGGGGGTGTISDITSTDGSVTITNPTGPTTDLSAHGIQFAAGYYNSNSLTVGSGSSANFHINHVFGATPLNLATPFAPTIVTTGVYAFTVDIQSTTNLAAGRSSDAVLSLNTPQVTSIESYVTGPTGGALVAFGLAGTSLMSAGDNLTVSMGNFDTVNVTYQIIAMTVQRLT